MRRRVARPFGQSTSIMRLASMLMALFVVWALYYRLKDPALWRFFTDEKSKVAYEKSGNETSEVVVPSEMEELVLGPNDLDDAETETVKTMFELITDRTPLQSREMHAYWRLMDWSRTQPFDQLKERAKNDVPFTQFWEQPEKYRGKPIQLRLHVRRVTEHQAPKDTAQYKNIYEAWGWTDESHSFPYLVVFPELPKGMPIGTEVRSDVEFVGYFLKIMSYTAKDNPRGVPLLVGRIRIVATPQVLPSSANDGWTILLVLVAGILVIGFVVGNRFRPRSESKLSMLPSELNSIEPVESSDENPFAQFRSTK